MNNWFDVPEDITPGDNNGNQPYPTMIWDAIKFQTIFDEYHKVRENNIQIDPIIKSRILNAVKKIPLKAYEDSNWNIFIEMKIWNYHCVFESINLKKESDEEFIWQFWDYRNERQGNWYTTCVEYYPQSRNPSIWENNKKLKEHLVQQKLKWLSIPKYWTLRIILDELWKVSNLNKDSDKIAMWMLLTL